MSLCVPGPGRWASASLALLLAACAAPTRTTPAPVYRQAEPGAGREPLREDFDPARFRQDLLLIEPLFTPPGQTAVTAEASPASEPEAAPRPLDGPPPPRADTTRQPVYRVQVIALSREASARRIAQELSRRFGVVTEVVPQGQLFAVRAGGFADPAAAGELKGRIATLSQGYAGAFVVGDSLVVDGDEAVPADGAHASVELDESGPAGDTTAVDTSHAPDLDRGDLPEPELVPTRGWRVLIEQFSDQAAARDYRARVMRRLRRDDVDVTFETPWFKVLVGSFRTQTEAQRFAERCRSLGYRNAARVPGIVYLPREEDR